MDLANNSLNQIILLRKSHYNDHYIQEQDCQVVLPHGINLLSAFLYNLVIRDPLMLYSNSCFACTCTISLQVNFEVDLSTRLFSNNPCGLFFLAQECSHIWKRDAGYLSNSHEKHIPNLGSK